jgi:hypothetical protein
MCGEETDLYTMRINSRTGITEMLRMRIDECPVKKARIEQETELLLIQSHGKDNE